MNQDVRKILVWMYSAAAAAFGGVGTAVSAAISGQAIGALSFTHRQLIAIALGGAVTAVAAYLKNSPLPVIE